MNPVMYIVLNKGAKMSTGKAAAQAAHAAVEAYLASPDDNLKRVWHRGGHYTKIVLEAKDAEELRTFKDYLGDRGFPSTLIVDEGRTEVDPFTPTALGVCIVDKDNAHVRATFSSFKLYTDMTSVVILDAERSLSPSDLAAVRDLILADRTDDAREFLRKRQPKRGWLRW